MASVQSFVKSRVEVLGSGYGGEVVRDGTCVGVRGEHEKLRRARGECWGCIWCTARTKSSVAREAKFTFICLNPARLLSKWYGESNKFADAYFSLANKLAPSILFIDEIDCLFRTKGREHICLSWGQYCQRATTHG